MTSYDKMARMKRVAISACLGAIAMVLSFALIFGGGLAWEVSRYPHDGQAGMGPLLVGVLLAPVIAALTVLVTLHRFRH